MLRCDWLHSEVLGFGKKKKKRSVDFTFSFCLSLSLSSSSSSASFLWRWMVGCRGRKCGLLLHTQKIRLFHKSRSDCHGVILFRCFNVSSMSISFSPFTLVRFLPPVNGTPASQLSTPYSGKSPSPSPTSPGSLSRRRVSSRQKKQNKTKRKGQRSSCSGE